MLTFRSANAVTAGEFEGQGNCFSPDIHIIESPDDTAASEWTQTILDKYCDQVIAYHIAPIMGDFTYSIELQFASTPAGRAAARECLKEYRSGFRKGGLVPRRKKQKNAKPTTGRRRRLLKNRMYRLRNGTLFWYYSLWDNHGNLIGKVESHDLPSGDGIPLENKIVSRSELENA